MRALLIYAVESSICLALFWGLYEIALRKDTRHERNRAFLLLSLLLSSVIPLITFSIAEGKSILPRGGFAEILLPEIRINAQGAMDNSLPGLTNIMLYIYVSGLAITGAWMISGSAKLIWKIIVSKKKNRIIYCDNDDLMCYSAFGYIFISRNIDIREAERMIAHERNHIRELHHIDLIISGALIVIQWFNPAAWLTGRSLQALHEYEADDKCILNGEDITSYQKLLVSSALKVPATLISDTFSNNSLLKNRIIMMTKKKSGSAASLKLILALPLAALMILAFSCKQKEAPEQTLAPEEVFTVVEEMPAFPGGDSALFSSVYKNITYPEEAKSKGIQGKVIVRFVVDAEGNVDDITVVRSVDPILDKAAIEAVKKLPKWIPGRQGGKPVSVYYSMPISFMLQ